MLKTFYVKLPDGYSAKRNSTHQYTHVVAVRELEKEGRLPNRWFAEWRTGIKAAEKRARYWATCPATRQGKTFETRIIELHTYATPVHDV